jgi:predicted PurR-regulated permease PerM
MNYFESIIKGEVLKKIMAILFLIAILYFFKSMINLFLLTFIFSYVFYSAQQFIYKKVNKVFKISRNLIAMGVYLLLVLLIVLFFVNYIPVITNQIVEISNEISNFDTTSLKDKLDPRILELVNGINIEEYLKQAGANAIVTIKNVGTVGLNVLLAFILSLFFVLEKDELKRFGDKLENSKISYFYKYYRFFAKHFMESFGNVLRMQFIVAFINGVLSTVMLAIIGFPQVLGLGFMIFLFGLIPVAGVMISLIPLSIIAFKIGGIIKVVYILVMIAILHALESYVLNPKLMASKTELPVFIIFAILLISEHLMGVWGLLIGLPLFMFLLKIVGAENIGKSRRTNNTNIKF